MNAKQKLQAVFNCNAAAITAVSETRTAARIVGRHLAEVPGAVAQRSACLSLEAECARAFETLSRLNVDLAVAMEGKE